MDNFMDKLAQKFSAQEVIKANSQAEAAEMKKLQLQVAEYEKICFSIREKAEGFNVTIKPVEQIEITQAKMIVTAEYVDIKDVVFEENTEYFDLNVESVTLRSFENGDKLVPLGKSKDKKIKEIFIN